MKIVLGSRPQDSRIEQFRSRAATYRAQAAIGPAGVQELTPGTWWLFAKVTASGETPIIPSGAFKVVP